MKPAAEILCVGTELLAGKPNTHISYMTPLLRAAGMDVPSSATLADDAGVIRDAVETAVSRADAVLVAGGLGPTFDDVTREGVSAGLGRKLIYRPKVYRTIWNKYRRCRLRVPPNNRKQAWVLDGARVLDNRVGSAPGQALTLPRADGRVKTVILLPGPFVEMKPIFEERVLPLLRGRYGRGTAMLKRAWRFWGLPESAVDRRLKPLLTRRRGDVQYTILASIGLVDVHASVSAPTERKARALLGRLDARVSRLMGSHLYGRDDESLESVLGAGLRRAGWRLATAESCTGGAVSGRITSVAGSSDYFLGGVVSYHDRLKHSPLGVPAGLLRRSGAVSAPCAREMAAGARELTGAEMGVSITGIAGPGGGSRAKPVGLVFIGVSAPGRTAVRRFLFPGSRSQVRRRASNAALALALARLPI